MRLRGIKLILTSRFEVGNGIFIFIDAHCQCHLGTLIPRGTGSELSSPTLHSLILASWVPTGTVTLPPALRGRDGEEVGVEGRDGRRNSMHDVMCAWERKGRKKGAKENKDETPNSSPV